MFECPSKYINTVNIVICLEEPRKFVDTQCVPTFADFFDEVLYQFFLKIKFQKVFVQIFSTSKVKADIIFVSIKIDGGGILCSVDMFSAEGIC